MAGVLNSSRLRKRKHDKMEAMSMNKYSLRNSSSKDNEQSKCFQENLLTFDSCRLVQIEDSIEVYCDICARKKIKVLTEFACNTCNVQCCLECYDFHHKQKMTEAIRNLHNICPENAEIFLNNNGHLSIEVPHNISENVSNASLYEAEYSELDNLEIIIDSLKKQFSEKIQAKFHFDQTLKSIYVSDEYMETFFENYPEFVSVVILCELVHLHLTMYALITEDANAHCEIFGVCFLFKENKPSLIWLCETLKNHHPSWEKINILFIDKKIQNIDIFKTQFPDSEILFSPFHAQRAFKFDVLCTDTVTKELKNALKLFKDILSSSSETEYEKHYQGFCKLCPSLTSYIKEKWHSTRHTWAVALKFASKTFLNSIEKFSFQVQKKVVPSLSTQKNFEAVVNVFFHTIFTFRKKYVSEVSAVFQTAKIISHMKTARQNYAKLLTHYGGKLVIEQMTLASDLRNLQVIEMGKFQIRSTSGTVSVTTSYCTCDFFTYLSLPCCHIFAARKHVLLPLFSESLCSSRWYAKQYQLFFMSVYTPTVGKYESSFSNLCIFKNLEKCFELTGEILPLLTSLSSDVSNQRCKIMCRLIEAWNHNVKVHVETMDSESKYIIHPDLSLDSSRTIEHFVSMYDISPEENDDDSDIESLCFSTSSRDSEVFTDDIICKSHI